MVPTPPMILTVYVVVIVPPVFPSLPIQERYVALVGLLSHRQESAYNLLLELATYPEELAEYAAFMVSDRNSFMNGEVVIVDGGAIT